MTALTLRKLRRSINEICEEVGGDLEHKIAAHKISPTIHVSIEDAESDAEYELITVEPTMLWGCGCWDGVRLVVRRVPKQ